VPGLETTGKLAATGELGTTGTLPRTGSLPSFTPVELQWAQIEYALPVKTGPGKGSLKQVIRLLIGCSLHLYTSHALPIGSGPGKEGPEVGGVDTGAG
jgi:hypothetical protein